MSSFAGGSASGPPNGVGVQIAATPTACRGLPSFSAIVLISSSRLVQNINHAAADEFNVGPSQRHTPAYPITHKKATPCQAKASSKNSFH
jgi:hypothetical protein